jgi:tRNA dimethylallyltransferase
VDRAIAIIGPTASGKTGLALALAERLTGHTFEAISADSRQVYRHMDIGTAKPTAEEQGSLAHHLVDIVDPDEPFSLATWLELAGAALSETWGRGNVPLIVGGTGQYVWALLEGWRVPKVPPQEALRRELSERPVADLLEELLQIDPETHATIQPNNARRIIRALEVYQVTGEPLSRWRIKEPPEFEWLAIAPRQTRDELYGRIDSRVDAMIKAGFVAEVDGLLNMGYARNLPSMSSIGYGEMCAHLAGELTLEEANYRTKVGTHRLVRHQNAWFKASDERIRWIEPADVGTVVALVEEFLGV